jgi:Flp pilus assembly protein TadB
MPRLLAASAVLLAVGATLILSELRWFSRQPLVERLRPYGPGGFQRGVSRSGVLSVASFREVIGPLARQVGEQLAGVMGVTEDVAVRLRRTHSTLDVTAFRVRQLGWAGAGFAAGALAAAATQPPLAVAMLFVLGGPALAFLIVEQQLASQSDRWKRRIFLELPVISEQLAMLLGAGYSLGSGLNRLAARGSGACATDLVGVCGRIRQGLSEVAALREWASIADVEALSRLVAVLALNREAGDLGRLVADEARSIRREVQRELIEQIERRAQQVWIPVTVATLVPGAVFLAIPFIEALRLFSTT